MSYVDLLNATSAMKVFFRRGTYWAITGPRNDQKKALVGNNILETWCLLEGGCYNKCYVNTYFV